MPTSKPLRAWLAASGADEIVIDPHGGWNEPTNRGGGDPARRPDRAGRRLGGAARRLEGRERPLPERWLDAERAAQAALDDRARRGSGDLTSRPCTCALGAAHRDGDLVYTASSMPIRDQETFLAARRRRRRSSSATAAPTASTASSPPGSAPPTPSGRPTTIVTGDLGLLHDIGGLAALRDVSTPVRIVVIDNDGGGIFHFLPQEQALGSDEFEALLGTPRGVDAAKAAALFDLPHRASSRSPTCPTRSPREPA